MLMDAKRNQFLSPLILEDLRDGKNWLVRHNLIYIDRAGNRWVVPKGFVTDLASIPRFIQNLIPKTGKYNSAAVLHDFLYTIQPVSPITVNKALADHLLREAMESCGVNVIARHLIYLGVRVGGSLIYAHHSADIVRSRISSQP